MAADIGSNGAAAYGGDNLPKPGVVVMQYTGHSSYTPNDPPTFALVGEHDGIANPAVMERRITNLRNAGIDAEFHTYRNVGHGFGLGTGTSAEGWHDGAVRFWEKHIK
jgi:predicted esterase